jgi:hypothetical protein
MIRKVSILNLHWVRTLIVIGLITIAALMTTGVQATVAPEDSSGHTRIAHFSSGFDDQGHMIVGSTDLESGVFPDGVECYELGPTQEPYVLDPIIAAKLSNAE